MFWCCPVWFASELSSVVEWSGYECCLGASLFSLQEVTEKWLWRGTRFFFSFSLLLSLRSLDVLFSDCPQALTWSLPVGLDPISRFLFKTRMNEGAWLLSSFGLVEQRLKLLCCWAFSAVSLESQWETAGACKQWGGRRESPQVLKF